MRAFNEFVERVGKVEAVEQVRGHVAGTYLHLVTYVSESDEAQRYAIYDVEQLIHDRYPEIKFEFDLIDRRGHAVEMAAHISDKYIRIIRQLPDNPNVIDQV